MTDQRRQTRFERSVGEAFVSFSAPNRLLDLRQSGSAKAMLPRVAGPVPEVVFLNTSGGLTGGDSLRYGLELQEDCQIHATTQTAERAYAAGGGVAVADMRATLGAGSRLDWLPQETILYEHSHLDRSTTIDLAGDAAVLLCEVLVLGRHAMGEVPASLTLTDRRLIRRDMRPVWAETLRLDGGVLKTATHAALLGGARALAVIALVAPGAADALPRLRAVLNEPGCEAAASGWDGKCIARILARDGWPLKRQVQRALQALRQGPLPRVWQMQGELA